jgi:hypothetical protein
VKQHENFVYVNEQGGKAKLTATENKQPEINGLNQGA